MIVKGQHIPDALSTHILYRALGEDGLESLYQQYSEAKKSFGAQTRMVTDQDLNILYEFRQGASQGELARKYNISVPKVSTALKLAALHKLGNIAHE